jgi:hypothetical protein
VRDGWTLVRRWDFKTGKQAFAAEREFFTIIRDKFQLPQHLHNKHLKYAGATETFPTSAISKQRVINMLDRILLSYS